MTPFLIRSRHRLQALLPPELEGRELRALLTLSDHSLLLSSRRARLIINRVRLFAFLFAVLTPLWCVVDFLVFDAPLWYYLAGLRLLASACFAVLLWHPPRDRMRDAYRVIAWLFAIPTLFYIASHSVLASYELNDFSQAVATGYAFLPFVLMAGLAVFPLTMLESLLVASSVLGAQLLAGYFSWSTLNWPSFLGGTWLLVLLAGVVVLAGMSQLAFMLVLVRQMIHDPLTGAYARGSGEEIMEVYWRRSLRQDEPLTLVFLDLDHFKTINDRYGHDAGDQVLSQFAHRVRGAVREQDVLVRWGGEEFVLLLPMTPHAVAVEVLRRVQAGGFGERPDGQPLTASMGLAERCQDGSETLAALLERADQRMYQAKNAGRNRLCGASGDC